MMLLRLMLGLSAALILHSVLFAPQLPKGVHVRVRRQR